VEGFRRVFQNHDLRKICIIPLLYNTFNSMTWSIAILYALDLGATILDINVITMVQGVMSSLLLVPVGLLSDRFGRKRLLLIPRGIAFLATFVWAVATEVNHLLVAAVIGGFAGGGVFPVLLSMIGDTTKGTDRSHAIGVLYILSSLGMVIGPFLGSVLLTTSLVNLRHLYQINVIAQGLMLVYIVLFIHDTRSKRVRRAMFQLVTQLIELLQRRTISALLLLSGLYFFYFAVMNTYIPLFLRTAGGFSDAAISSLALAHSCAIILMRLLMVSSRFTISPRRLLMILIVMAGVSSFVTPLSHQYVSFMIIQLGYGASFGGIVIVSSHLVADNTTRDNRGVANAFLNLAQSTGNITKLLTTPIAESDGLSTVFLISGICAVSSLLPLWMIRWNNTKQAHK
jgi:MFS family permease